MINSVFSGVTAVAFIAATLISFHATAQSSDPAWLEDLEYELAVEQECEVAEYLNIHEGQLGGRNMYTAKVKCKDGREFDANKLEPQDKFDIKICEVITC